MSFKNTMAAMLMSKREKRALRLIEKKQATHDYATLKELFTLRLSKMSATQQTAHSNRIYTYGV